MTRKRKRLGELVLRSDHPQKMVNFYREIIGLELFETVGTATFLKVDDDFEGHPQLLAIFETTHKFSGPQQMKTNVADASAGTLHHFAFVIDNEEFTSEVARLKRFGVNIQSSEHPRFGWRSVYLFDPDGNSVELVSYDPTVLDSKSGVA